MTEREQQSIYNKHLANVRAQSTVSYLREDARERRLVRCILYWSTAIVLGTLIWAAAVYLMLDYAVRHVI